jgi:hypothetical protein
VVDRALQLRAAVVRCALPPVPFPTGDCVRLAVVRCHQRVRHEQLNAHVPRYVPRRSPGDVYHRHLSVSVVPVEHIDWCVPTWNTALLSDVPRGLVVLAGMQHEHRVHVLRSGGQHWCVRAALRRSLGAVLQQLPCRYGGRCSLRLEHQLQVVLNVGQHRCVSAHRRDVLAHVPACDYRADSVRCKRALSVVPVDLIDWRVPANRRDVLANMHTCV